MSPCAEVTAVPRERQHAGLRCGVIHRPFLSQPVCWLIATVHAVVGMRHRLLKRLNVDKQKT